MTVHPRKKIFGQSNTIFGHRKSYDIKHNLAPVQTNYFSLLREVEVINHTKKIGIYEVLN